MPLLLFQVAFAERVKRSSFHAFFGPTHCIFALLTMNALHALMNSNNKVFVHCTVCDLRHTDRLPDTLKTWCFAALGANTTSDLKQFLQTERTIICDKRAAVRMRALPSNKHTQTCTRHGWLLSQCARLLVYEMRGVPFISSPLVLLNCQQERARLPLGCLSASQL